MIRRRTFTLRVAGRPLRLGERTIILGVVNVTPDSFSDGGLYFDPERAVEHGRELVRQGADWLDVGGESTRPGARPLSGEEELRRVLPVIRGLSRKLPLVPVSIDTTKAEVAQQAIRAGASIINDVSGLRFDARLADVARRYRTPLILMHLRGRPATMQQRPFARSVWRSVMGGLERSIRRALARGVRRSQLIVDPGFGFGKSRRQNFEILAQLRRLETFRLPILVGTSRKSFVQAVVWGESLTPKPGAKPRERLWPLSPRLGRGARRASSGGHSPPPLPLLVGDAAAVVATILGGAHIVRVHDVAAVLPAARIADAILASRAEF
jgi:dihydropteroate synthase